MKRGLMQGLIMVVMGMVLMMWASPSGSLTQGWIRVSYQAGLLERIQSISPHAQLRTWQGETVIDAGGFGSPDQADILLQSLELLGLRGEAMPQQPDPVATPTVSGFEDARMGSAPLSPPALIAAYPSLSDLGIAWDPPVHLPYPLADWGSLMAVGGQRPEQLHREAAQAFLQMQAAAQQAGIRLVPLSGFRDWATQTMLFQRQIQRRGSERAARFLSAPPGFSEHHTGYALDIGDGSFPYTHIKYSFADTGAYGWLQAEAGSFGFELSFPPNNPQGVSFEPWHWRYVGSPQSRQLFALAQQIALSEAGS
jgi:D-alanyl-D-alanine carboxypeptidase